LNEKHVEHKHLDYSPNRVYFCRDKFKKFVLSEQYFQNRDFLERKYINQKQVEWVLKGVNSLRQPANYLVWYVVFTILWLGCLGFAIWDYKKYGNYPWTYFKSSYEKDKNKGWYKYYEIWIFLVGIVSFILIPVIVFLDSKEEAGHKYKIKQLLDQGSERAEHVKWCMDTQQKLEFIAFQLHGPGKKKKKHKKPRKVSRKYD